ncbi:hypothetical protein VCHENC02_0788A, partial [Vibrio harveyi]
MLFSFITLSLRAANITSKLD